jgi:glucan biosynthesis protein
MAFKLSRASPGRANADLLTAAAQLDNPAIVQFCPDTGELRTCQTADSLKIWLASTALLFLIGMHSWGAESTAFSFQSLTERARDLAAKDFQADTAPELPDFLKKIGYDQYQDIRFRAQQSPWYHQQLPFDIQFFHRGYLFIEPVKIHLIESSKVRDVSFSPDQFSYGHNQFPKPIPLDLDFAGFRALYTFTPEQKRATGHIVSIRT